MPATRDIQTDGSAIEPRLAGLQNLQRLSPGAVLFSEGDAPRGVYIVHSGAVDLVFAAPDGTIRPLQPAGEGQIIGLSAVVSGRKHDATAIVTAPSEIGYVEKRLLMDLLERDPAAWFEVLQFLSHDVSSCLQSIRKISSTPR